MKVEQLVGNLQTFEANLCVKNKKPKGIALKSSKNDSEDDLELDPNMMALLVKNFKKFLKTDNKNMFKIMKKNENETLKSFFNNNFFFKQ